LGVCVSAPTPLVLKPPDDAIGSTGVASASGRSLMSSMSSTRSSPGGPRVQGHSAVSAATEEPFADDAPELLIGKLRRDNANEFQWWKKRKPLVRERELVALLRRESGVQDLHPSIGDEWTKPLIGLTAIARELGVERATSYACVAYRNRLMASCGYRWLKFREEIKDGGRQWGPNWKGRWVFSGSFREAIAKDLYFPGGSSSGGAGDGHDAGHGHGHGRGRGHGHGHGHGATTCCWSLRVSEWAVSSMCESVVCVCV
jgi:hypothetical protein